MYTLLKRGLFSITKIRSSSGANTIKLRSSIFANVLRKMFNKPTISWTHSSILATQPFENLTYSYYIPKNSDFNIYLNPYFHENDITTFVIRNLQKNDVFIDVGAHAGLYTIIAGMKASNGCVYSFEPNPFNLEYLRKHLEINHITNVNVVPKAMSNTKGKIRLTFDSDHTAICSGVHNEIDEQCIIRESTTLDYVLSKKPIDIIKILKIDTEGYDFQVLQGATRILKKTKYVIIELHEQFVRDFLVDNGFMVSDFKPSAYLLATNPKL